MILTWPWALVFLVLPVGVAVLWLLRPQGRSVRVGSLTLWEPTAESAPPTDRPKPKRLPLHLLLWLLAGILVCLALTGPVIPAKPETEPIRFIIDTSPSTTARMSDTDPGPRCRAMAEWVEKLLTRYPAGPSVECWFGPSDSPAGVALKHPVKNSEAVYPWAGGEITTGSFSRFVRRVMLTPFSGRTVIVTDGGEWKDVSHWKEKKDVFPVGFGQGVANTGIDRIGAAKGQLFVGITGKSPKELLVEIDPQKKIRRKLKPGQKDIILSADFEDAKNITVRLLPTDGYPADNFARLTRQRTRPVLLGWRGPKLPALARAIDALVRLKKVRLTNNNHAPQIVFCSRRKPASLHSPALIVRPAPPGAKVLDPIVSPQPNHPLAAHVDFSALRVKVAFAEKSENSAAPWQPLVSSDGIALIEYRTGPVRQVRLNFALDRRNTDWPLDPGFVLFIANAVSWLSYDRAEADQWVAHLQGESDQVALSAPPGPPAFPSPGPRRFASGSRILISIFIVSALFCLLASWIVLWLQEN